MRETNLSTLLYKYNPYARFVFFIYATSIVLLYLFTCDKLPPYIITMGLCIATLPVVYGAIFKKSIFNFRAWDSRMLTLASSYIQIGKQRYNIIDIKLDVQVHAYDGFLYRVRRKGLLVPQSTYGDNNMLFLHYNGVSYDMEFLLRDYDAYATLLQLIDEWKEKGVAIEVKEGFNREFVRKQHVRKIRSKKETYFGF
jgi:hypothetical protein